MLFIPCAEIQVPLDYTPLGGYNFNYALSEKQKETDFIWQERNGAINIAKKYMVLHFATVFTEK